MQTPQAQPADTATPTLSARAIALTAQRLEVLSHYDQIQKDAALLLYDLVQAHLGTSGGNAAAKLLLGLYNGNRFPFDLTELRIFDLSALEAAFTVMLMDATRCWCEIHVLIDAIRGTTNTGTLFEVWAYQLKLKGSCTTAGYVEMLKNLKRQMV